MSKLKSSEDIILGVGQHRERTEVVERLVITSKYVENNKSQVFYCHRRELHIKGVTYKGRKLGEFHDGLELEVLVLSHGFWQLKGFWKSVGKFTRRAQVPLVVVKKWRGGAKYL